MEKTPITATAQFTGVSKGYNMYIAAEFYQGSPKDGQLGQRSTGGYVGPYNTYEEADGAATRLNNRQDRVSGHVWAVQALSAEEDFPK